MDYDNPQFITAVKKVLRDSLAQLSDSLNDLKESVSAHWQADEKRYQAKPVTVADLRTDVPIQVQTEAKRSKPENVWRYIVGTLEALAFIAVIVYAFFSYHQWREMVGATDAAQRAVDEARRNRVQAEKSLNASIAQFRLDQRAWVGVTSADAPDLKPKPDFFITLHVTNSGHSPALNFQSETVLHSLTKHETFKPIYGPPDEIPSRGVIQPGEVIQLMTNKFPITQPQIDWVKDGRYILYVYGRMTYDDVFKVNHHTTFCKEILSESLIKDCGTYNTAD